MIKKNIKEIGIVVIIDENNGIGKDGDLLCHLPNDLKHFKQITTGQSIIMGRKTFESLPKGALPNRINIVITSDNKENYPGCIVARSVDEAILLSEEQEKVYIVGGGKIYNSTLHLANKLYLTRIHHIFDEADTFFPEIDFDNWKLVEEEKHKADEKHLYDYSFQTYQKL
jgi:dihydrofolate reductase